MIGTILPSKLKNFASITHVETLMQILVRQTTKIKLQFWSENKTNGMFEYEEKK